jgi:DNA processing protein
MKINKLTFDNNDYPEVLRCIPDAPKELYVLGSPLLELLAASAVAIVGSRKVTPYGKTVTTQFATDIARAGVTVVSGLAIGIDGLAHRGALAGKGRTIAVLPGGLDGIYPSSHRQLARQILEQGGALVSEYPPGMHPMKHHFIARNRIVSGLANALLITEGAVNSGSLHTARFALEQGRDVMAVPGNITSPTSAGTNNLIKSGATPVTSAEEVLQILGVEQVAATTARYYSADPHEQQVLSLMQQGTSDGGELLRQTDMGVSLFNQTLTMLEIRGRIRPLGNNQWAVT